MAGLDFTFENPVEYPGLRIKKTPSVVNGLLCAAFCLMIVGLWFCFFQTPAIVTMREDGYCVSDPKPQNMEIELSVRLETEIESQMITKPLELDHGYLVVPYAPGIGIELVDNITELFSPAQRSINCQIAFDGSVRDV